MWSGGYWALLHKGNIQSAYMLFKTNITLAQFITQYIKTDIQNNMYKTHILTFHMTRLKSGILRIGNWFKLKCYKSTTGF